MYQVEANSELMIRDTPWIFALEGYIIPNALNFPQPYSRLRDITLDGDSN